ncbi:RsiV family protein [Bacillus xiapuensis]|uniref:RsiV family protein n=1 Tax=Bacillus xiapuensis TaxID=2014075 RepID=UPI000C230BBD|nr:RsiV family protein [Bacillus xiapuensis]
MMNSYSEFMYDTIDKKNEVLITLPSLFKDDSYIRLISQNIKKQMKQQMEADPQKIYWDDAQAVDKNQPFYISDKGKPVLVFTKYEVAPGVMGVCEFTVPTDVIEDALVSKQYIK